LAFHFVARAVGRDRIGGRLDGGTVVVAMALLADQMLGDFVLARFLAVGERMALPALRFALIRSGHRRLPRRTSEGPPEKVPGGPFTWSAAGSRLPGSV